MNTLFPAIVIGISAGAVLTVILWVLARRDLLRRFQQHPPPAALEDSARYTRRPMAATFGAGIFVWMFVGFSLAGAAVAYVALAGSRRWDRAR